MVDSSSVILYEPQCSGFEHAAFNAAVLQTLALAQPDRRLVFIAEGQHLFHVREACIRAGCTGFETIEWQEIAIPPRGLAGWRRLRRELILCHAIVNKASSPKVQAVILCSLTDTGLLVLKTLLGVRRTAPVLAVLHGILSSLERPQPTRPWNWATHLRQVLRLPHPKQLTYLALGGSIYSSLVVAMPQAVSHFRVLDPPYFMDGTVSAVDSHTRIRFGYFGVGRNAEKAFDQFVRLAQEARAMPGRHESEFLIVGHVQAGRGDPPLHPQVIQGACRAPLSLDEYRCRARTVTYAVSLADPAHYRLAASASFLDALCYSKPGIYLRNPYVEYYFDCMGDIGYLCDSYAEVRDVVLSLIQKFPEARYRQQCQNIRNGRLRFEPQAVAPRLLDIVKECQEALDN